MKKKERIIRLLVFYGKAKSRMGVHFGKPEKLNIFLDYNKRSAVFRNAILRELD